MKRTLGILLLGIQLLAATELHQLLKLPALVEHLREHRAEWPDLTLWEFLAIHYDRDAPIDEDHDHDMKLPFKQCTPSHFVWTCEHATWAPFFFPEKMPARPHRAFVCADQDPLPNGAGGDVWHPPQF